MSNVLLKTIKSYNWQRSNVKGRFNVEYLTQSLFLTYGIFLQKMYKEKDLIILFCHLPFIFEIIQTLFSLEPFLFVCNIPE